MIPLCNLARHSAQEPCSGILLPLVAHRNRRLFDCGQLTLREARYLIVAFTVMTDVPEVVGP